MSCFCSSEAGGGEGARIFDRSSCWVEMYDASYANAPSLPIKKTQIASAIKSLFISRILPLRFSVLNWRLIRKRGGRRRYFPLKLGRSPSTHGQTGKAVG